MSLASSEELAWCLASLHSLFLHHVIVYEECQVGTCPIAVCINVILVVCWDAKGKVRGPLLMQ